MNSHDAELRELRARLEKLEQEVAALRGAANTPVAPREEAPPLIAQIEPVAPPPAPPGAEPPVVAAVPSAKLPPRPPAVADRLDTLPSTVWVAGAGAIIFLIGAIYGLTVSIQRGWISPPVRVGAGLVTGLAAGIFAARLLLAGRQALGVTLLAVGAGTWMFALYFGSHGADLFPLGLGFAGAAVATLLAGGLAARIRSDAAFAVALAVGLAAPVAFSDGTGTLVGLLGYLCVLLVGQLAVHYTTGEGAEWTASRLLGTAGVWGVALLAGFTSRLGPVPLAFLLVAAVLALTLALAWLPRHPAPAEEPVAASTLVLVAACLGSWSVWRRADFDREPFSLVFVAFAALSLALVVAARRRGTIRNETPLVLAAVAFALMAVPTAISWRWVGLAWGVGALSLAVGARLKARTERDDSLALGAVIFTMAATAVWLGRVLDYRGHDFAFVNPRFLNATLAAAAWVVLSGVPGVPRWLSFGAAQAVAVNALAWELARTIDPVSSEHATLALGPLLATLTYAGAGVGLWLRGVLYEADHARAKGLRAAGYVWLVVAAVKLLGYDLSDRDLLFRAVAALGVGAVFIGAAWWADRVRAKGGAR